MLLVMLHDLADCDHPNGRYIRFESDDLSAAARTIADAYGKPVEEIEAQLRGNLHNNGDMIPPTTAVEV
jgi:hypothetical protein